MHIMLVPAPSACAPQVTVDDTGGIAVTCSDDGTAKVWDTDDAACKATLSVGCQLPTAMRWYLPVKGRHLL